MIRLRHKMLIRVMRLLDQSVLIVTAMAVIYHRPLLSLPGKMRPFELPHHVGDTIGMLALAIGWLAIFDYCIRYKSDRFGDLRSQLKNLIKATTIAAFWFMLITALCSVRSVNTLSVVAFWCIVTIINSLSRVVVKLVLESARKSGYNHRYLLVVGTNFRASEIVGRITAHRELGYKIVGFVAESQESQESWDQRGNEPALGKIDDIRSILETERVDEMLVCLSSEAKFHTMSNLISHARDLGIVLRILPDAGDIAMLRKLHVEEFENECVLTLFREQLLTQLLAKRVVDVLASGMALIVFAPLMMAIALAIKITSPGPVFFSQDRVGMNQRRFKLYKFRSMVIDAEKRKAEIAHLNELDGPAFKINNDPRITRIGRFIRKTSIDELPQLINVIRGEMSLVGPRPPLPDEVRKYQWLFRRRLSVKPGITCVWQVSGRSSTTFDEWMNMDRDYVENWSIWLDIKILLKTIPAVLFCRGAS